MKRISYQNVIFILNLILYITGVSGNNWIVSVNPAPFASDFNTDFPVTIEFNRKIDPASVENNIRVFGEFSGLSTILDPEVKDYAISFKIKGSFVSGEIIHINILPGLQDSSGLYLPVPYQWEFRNTAQSGSGFFGLRQTISFDNPVSDFCFSDFNRDRRADMITLCGTADQLFFIKNDGDLQFSKTEISSHAKFPSSVSSADYNLDERTDFAVLYGGSFRQKAYLKIFNNNGGGNFSESHSYLIQDQPANLVSDDMDSNGFPDLVFITRESLLNIYWNDSTGAFPASDIIEIPGIKDFDIADIDNDGLADIIAVAPESNVITIFYNDSLNSFKNTYFIPQANSRFIAVDDFDNDNLPDISVTTTAGIKVFKYFGNNLFLEKYFIDDDTPVHLADFNADQIFEPLTYSGKIFYQDAFEQYQILSQIVDTKVLKSADLNSDQSIDIAAVPVNLNQINLYYNGISSSPFDLIQPQNNQTVQTQAGKANFKWQRSVDMHNREVHYSLNIFNLLQDTLIENLSDTAFEFDGSKFLKPSHEYSWLVTADNGEVEIRCDNIFNFTVNASNTIGQFRILTPSHDDTVAIKGNPLQFKWEKPTDLANQKFQYNIYLNGSLVDTVFPAIADTFFVLEPSFLMLPYARYSWYVEADNGYYTRKSDNQNTFIIDNYNLLSHFDLLFPVDGAVISKNDSLINFMWNQSRDVRGYFVYYELEIIYDDTLITIPNIYDNEISIAVSHYFKNDISRCIWRVKAIGDGGYYRYSFYRAFEFETPYVFSVSGNYPNPFNNGTVIRYQLPSQSNVCIDIYNSTGQYIQNLLDRTEYAGTKKYRFKPDGRYASGIYFLKISALQQTKILKILLVR